MILFDYFWVWLLAPLPLLAHYWLPTFEQHQDKLHVPYFITTFHDRVESAQGHNIQATTQRVPIIHWLIWLLLLSAAARPVLLEPPVTKTQPKRDIVLAIDLSQSMSEKDIDAPGDTQIERLSAVKQTVAQFIAQRKDDRIGLVGFGDQAFALAPPSSEHDTLILILSMTETSIAGPNTALGDAIGVTLKLLERSNLPEQMMILLSDGEDNRSHLDPRQAARIAADRNLLIHTIAFGQPESSGDSRVDLETLSNIAKQTGGQAFSAADQQALERVYREIDSMTPHTALELEAQPRRELFWLPAALALGLILLQQCAGIFPLILRSDLRQKSAGEQTDD